MKWLIGILSLGTYIYTELQQVWVILVMLPVNQDGVSYFLLLLPLVVAGALFYFGLKWWIALGIGGICLGLTAAGRAGFIIGVGMSDD